MDLAMKLYESCDFSVERTMRFGLPGSEMLTEAEQDREGLRKVRWSYGGEVMTLQLQFAPTLRWATEQIMKCKPRHIRAALPKRMTYQSRERYPDYSQPGWQSRPVRAGCRHFAKLPHRSTAVWPQLHLCCSLYHATIAPEDLHAVGVGEHGSTLNKTLVSRLAQRDTPVEAMWWILWVNRPTVAVPGFITRSSSQDVVL